MKIAMFNSKPWDREFFSRANSAHGHELVFHQPHLDETTVELVKDEDAVCVFINDTVSRPVLEALKTRGVSLVATRSAGFNHIDLPAAHGCGITIVRVPAYSPHAVAEHAVGLLLSLNRRLHRAFNRVREGDFSLNGLMGFDIHKRVVGVIGAGKIGIAFISIMRGFGCRVLVYDPAQSGCEGVEHVGLDTLLSESDIISLHCPLTAETKHMIDKHALAKMKAGVTLINTSRGALLDTRAVIHALKTRRIGLLGLDVYEEEEQLFFEDHSDTVIQDDVFARLLTFPNVLITGHQAFFTSEAVTAIAETTLANISAFEKGLPLDNRVS